MKRFFLFLATNLAVMLVLSVVTSVLGVNTYLTTQGLDLGKLLGYAAVIGFGGSFISLLFSKQMAKMATGSVVIDRPSTPEQEWLVGTVAQLAQGAGLSMPEVAVYEGEPNAFATGASRNHALVAVSTGLLQSMSKQEVEAVLAHEIAHIQNGDMVTLTLIQGVVNTFVFFLARVVGQLIDGFLRKQDDESGETSHGYGIGYHISVFVCEIVFGILASMIVMSFSRQREFRADKGAANLMGTPTPMIAALHRLEQLSTGDLPQSMAASGIVDGKRLLNLFASHPSLEERIKALQQV